MRMKAANIALDTSEPGRKNNLAIPSIALVGLLGDRY